MKKKRKRRSSLRHIMPLSTGSTKHGFDNLIAGNRTRNASVENYLQSEGSYITTILFCPVISGEAPPSTPWPACCGLGRSECAQFSKLFIV